MAEFFVIRHKATQTLMPETRSGYSYWEPLEKYKNPPRLFLSALAARRSIAAWYQGTFAMRGYGGGGSILGDDEYLEIEITPKADRSKGDLEVCAVNLAWETKK